MKQILIFSAVFSLFLCHAAPAVWKQKNHTECLKLTDALAARAHGPGVFYDNLTKQLDENPKQLRLWYNDKEWTFCFRDESDLPDAVWELHLANSSSSGDLLILSAETGGKLTGEIFARRKGGIVAGKKSSVTDFGTVSVQKKDGIRTVTVKIPAEKLKPFTAPAGANGAMNCFYIVNGKTPKVSAWNPTGNVDRTFPWCLGRLLIMK